MIVYDLMCEEMHQFEGWFKNADELQSQREAGLLECPICGNVQIRKVPSPNRINLISSAGKASQELSSLKAEARAMADKIHHYVVKNFEDVGEKFANEALKIHYGEAETRNIRGIATQQEMSRLQEEGIDALEIAGFPAHKKKLN
jgi:hypothetical protein